MAKLGVYTYGYTNITVLIAHTSLSKLAGVTLLQHPVMIEHDFKIVCMHLAPLSASFALKANDPRVMDVDWEVRLTPRTSVSDLESSL